ncbi:MAG: hypothetical protein ABI629_12855 [bacterium]
MTKAEARTASTATVPKASPLPCRFEDVEQARQDAAHQQHDPAERHQHQQGAPQRANRAAGAAGQHRHQRQQRHDGEILNQQHTEHRLPRRAGNLTAILQQPQHHRRRRQRESVTDQQRAVPCNADQAGVGSDRQPGEQDLQQPDARHAPQLPQARRPHLQADDEQQQHHAELAEAAHIADAARQAETRRAEHHPGGQ